MSYMNVEKQSKTLSTTGFQWITREHHSEQLRFLARKTNIWSNTSHSHATILLLEPLVYGGEISFKSDSTRGWIEKSDPLHWGEFNSANATLNSQKQRHQKDLQRSIETTTSTQFQTQKPKRVQQQWLFSSSLRNSSRRKTIGKSTWPKDDQAPPWTTMDHQRTNSLRSNGVSSFFLHLSFTSHCKKCYRAGTPESVLLRWIQDMELKTAPILALP